MSDPAAHDPKLLDAARAAERALATIMANRPHKTGHDFSQATRCLAALRDELIAERRREGAPPEAHQRLSRLNAVISAVLGGQYPLGSIQWQHVTAAHDSFGVLLDELGVQP